MSRENQKCACRPYGVLKTLRNPNGCPLHGRPDPGALDDGDDGCWVDGCDRRWVVGYEDGVRHCDRHKRDDMGGHRRATNGSEVGA